MLISIERLREIADKVEPIRLSFDDFVSMARELLERREAERKANSWDDAGSQHQSYLCIVLDRSN